MVKREIRIKYQMRKAYLTEEPSFPSIRWLLDDWGRWVRNSKVDGGLSYYREWVEVEPRIPEKFFISDDQAITLERQLKVLGQVDQFKCECVCKYYLKRDISEREAANNMSVSRNRFVSILRSSEMWLHAKTHDWADPLYQRYLRWEGVKKERQDYVKALAAGLGDQD